MAALRCVIRPGITGWAQVRYGYANDLEEEIEKMRYDLYYIKHMSLRLDLRIILDTVKVACYGSEMPLNQVSQVHAPEAQLLTVQPHDPSIMGDIEKAIRSAGLGLNPQNDGKIIRIPIPTLTEERRKDMVKHLHKILEDHRTAVRNIRRDGNEAIKKAMKDKKIAEDEERRALEEIQKLTDDEIKKMEELSKNKEKELMTV